MSTKYYRVKKDTFLWQAGAILEIDRENGSKGGYSPISDIWDVITDKEDVDGEYISAVFVENNPEWFERVYKVDLATKTIYEVKEKAKELMTKSYKQKGA